MRFATILALLAFAPAASSQVLPSGTWTGTWTAGTTSHAATADIERCATGFRIHLTADGHTAETETATWENGQLRFTTDRTRLPGMVIPRALTCALASVDGGGLAGSCTAGRSRYRVALAPPADGTFGCDT